MPRRPKDSELCREFRAKLEQAVVGKVSKKAAAAVLGVSRQMLDVYLNEGATPGPDVIVRAMKKWEFTLTYRGRELTVAQLTRPEPEAVDAQPHQLPLGLEDAILSLEAQDVTISLAKKEPDRIDLQVSIKFAG